MFFTYTEPGFVFVCTQKGYDKTPDRVKHERAPGKPVKGYEYCVPTSWIKKGYVEAVKECIVLHTQK